MASPYRNRNGYTYAGPSSRYYDDTKHQPDNRSIWDDVSAGAQALLSRLRAYCNARGRPTATNLVMQSGRQIKRNLAMRRLLSFPHLLVALWVIVLLWGERWLFASKVSSCDWDHWEKWPSGATPHRLIFVADPQITDPHSYPGRPWPLNPLTIQITDNYLRRSYVQLQKVLQPDTVMFLGDLFDGGREWKTAHGDFSDPEWAKGNRPASEQKHLKDWHRNYGEDYWLQEYARFGEIFYNHWSLGGLIPSAGQRGRKLITSLPGNHDLGFGAEVKIPVRRRFEAYFGETNRVDVIGNHTFVSVDTVSLSAVSSNMKSKVDLTGIYSPVEEFLRGVKAAKRRAVAKELKFWKGEVDVVVHNHRVEDLSSADFKNLPTMDGGKDKPDFPSVLLTHVPLYRDPGTPCGPLREHWPPATPPKGQTTPVVPDHRNAISVSSGYQYQNVLSDTDSINLIKSIGNVINAFSGDDHDYCEIVHTEEKENVREITVKSLSMVMGVRTPGFQMVSLWNPVDDQGRPLPGADKTTLQTHLCLLPNQLSTYLMYAVLGVLSVVILVARAFLVPILNLQPFALETTQPTESAILPVFKAKVEAEPDHGHADHQQSSGTSSSKFSSARVSNTTRGRSESITNGLARGAAPKWKGKGGARKWGWGENRGPRIEIRRDVYGGGGKAYGSTWKAASRTDWRSALRSRTTLIGREAWTTIWRVAWMVLGFFAYLTYKG